MTYPPQGWAQPGPAEQQPTPAPESRKALGIAAAVLGGACGLAALVFGVWIGAIWVVEAIDDGPTEFDPFEGIGALVAAVGGIFLLIGAILHGKRKNAGRVLLVIGFVPTLAFAVLPPMGIAVAAAPIIPVVLAFVSRAWCVPKQRAYPQQWGYQYAQAPYGQHQQPGYPQGYPQSQQVPGQYGQAGYGQQPPRQG